MERLSFSKNACKSFALLDITDLKNSMILVPILKTLILVDFNAYIDNFLLSSEEGFDEEVR